MHTTSGAHAASGGKSTTASMISASSSIGSLFLGTSSKSCSASSTSSPVATSALAQLASAAQSILQAGCAGCNRHASISFKLLSLRHVTEDRCSSGRGCQPPMLGAGRSHQDTAVSKAVPVQTSCSTPSVGETLAAPRSPPSQFLSIKRAESALHAVPTIPASMSILADKQKPRVV